MISCGSRLAPFDIPQLREIMAYDELELDRIGDRKTAVFFTISDTTPTYNFLVALAFSQMFNLLCERADSVHGGRLPHHVRVLWDEAANTGQVPQLEKLVAVIRSREVSLTLFYQQMAQCKAIYKGRRRPAGMCGEMRWKVPCRTSGQSVQRWPGRKGSD